MKTLLKLSDSNLALASEVIELIQSALEAGQNYRANEFLRTVETRYELMTSIEKDKFKECINSPSGQKVVADFAVAIATTPSSIVNAALALLYAQDPDFLFGSHEVERFVSAVSGLTDRKVGFLLKLNRIEKLDIKTLYPSYVINRDNFGSLDNVIDIDELFIYVSDMQSRGLLLMETNQQKSFGFGRANEDIDWSVKYSVSDTQGRFISLLRKANEYVA
ncbi:hypothetical protein OTK59_12130 [Vibrio natriegens]|uniref:hypothetical protein n=1 Tax=Vibrio natriegens TaxID=691 RepID=UPI0022850374|nr:hypothetical protein [Vibrio natriegens]MCY9877305.1 hypothetical protein [Vibrio natriegens]